VITLPTILCPNPRVHGQHPNHSRQRHVRAPNDRSPSRRPPTDPSRKIRSPHQEEHHIISQGGQVSAIPTRLTHITRTTSDIVIFLQCPRRPTPPHMIGLTIHTLAVLRINRLHHHHLLLLHHLGWILKAHTPIEVIHSSTWVLLLLHLQSSCPCQRSRRSRPTLIELGEDGGSPQLWKQQAGQIGGITRVR